MITISGAIILFLVSPLGFLTILPLLLYLEYLTLKSLLSDYDYDLTASNVRSTARNVIQRFLPLSPSEKAALSVVVRREHAHTKEIAQSIGYTNGTTRKVMKDLLRKGYVSRQVSPTDHRMFRYAVAHRHWYLPRRYRS